MGLVLHGLDRPLTGVTRVGLELARALHENPNCELIVLATDSRARQLRESDGVVSTHLPGCRRVPGLMVLGGPLVALAARRFRLDLVHDPVGVSPFTLGRWAGSFRRVLTIHDAIAFRFPAGYSWSNNLLHRRFVPYTLRHVDAVVTVSEHARTDLIRFLDLDPDRLWVVPDGISRAFRPVADSRARALRRRYGIGDPFVLFVGTRQPRKNLTRLVTAFDQLRDRLPALQLVVAGPASPEGGLEAQVRSLALADRVRLIGPVPEEDLPTMYAAAQLFVFPSLEEGFGLPVLEAMACGTPVVCSDAASLPEVAGEAALLVNAAEPDELSGAIWRGLTDEPLRASLRARGLKRARSYAWTRVAQEMIDVYRSVVAQPPGRAGRGHSR